MREMIEVKVYFYIEENAGALSVQAISAAGLRKKWKSRKNAILRQFYDGREKWISVVKENIVYTHSNSVIFATLFRESSYIYNIFVARSMFYADDKSRRKQIGQCLESYTKACYERQFVFWKLDIEPCVKLATGQFSKRRRRPKSWHYVVCPSN